MKAWEALRGLVSLAVIVAFWAVVGILLTVMVDVALMLAGVE